MFELISNHEDLWKYISIPLAFAFALSACNGLLINLNFYPHRFIGLFKRIGWHGIAHRHAEDVGAYVAEHLILKLSTMNQLVETIEPAMLVNQIERVLRPHLDEYVDEVMVKEKRIVWENLPFFIKNRAYARSHRQLRRIVDDLIDDVSSEIHLVFDLNHLVATQLKKDPALLNRIFLEAGSGITNFLIQGAMLTALVLGSLPAILMFYAPQFWILPLFGVAVGFTTNSLLIKLVYGPKKGFKIGPLTWEGALYRNRHRISEILSDILAYKILTMENIMESIFHGPKYKRTRQLVRKHVHPIIDGTIFRTLSQIALGARGFIDLKNTVTDKVVDISSFPFEDRDFNNDRGRVVKALYKKQLDSYDNEELLHFAKSAFERHEIWLYFSGSIVGGVIGTALYIILFKLV